MALRGGLEDLAAQSTLSHVIGRCVNADKNARSGLRELLNGVAAVEPALPKLLVVPGVFADRERGLLSLDGEWKLLHGARDVSGLDFRDLKHLAAAVCAALTAVDLFAVLALETRELGFPFGSDFEIIVVGRHCER